jgi:hypothetical protein
MWRFLGGFGAALIATAIAVPSATGVEKSSKIDELVGMHDLSTSVSIGSYYLKQEALQAARAVLLEIGRREELGPEWNSGNAHWREAEASLLAEAERRIDREFGSLVWLRPLWADLSRSEFSEEEIDALLAHFRSEVGRKQMRIINHTVSTHVMMALSFSGRLKDVPGIEQERSRMQALWNAEERAMRFSLHDAANVEGQRFALSSLGKKYFATAVLRLTGLLSRRIDELAAGTPQALAAEARRVEPHLEAFRGERG